MNTPKVIMLYNKIMHYRVPVWNLLAEHCELTVAYSEGQINVPKGTECKFQIIYLPIRKYGRFVIQKNNIRKLVKEYDVAICYGDIAWLKYSTLPWFNNAKIVYHTLGVSASYDKGFDEHKEWDAVRKFFYSKANALAFYTSYPIEKYAAMGVPREKMFVAPNTVEVHPLKNKENKDSILFIGTLYRQKGVQLLLDAYLKLRDVEDLPKLRIIGSGPDSEEIKLWIEDNKMYDLIEMVGAVYDIDEKAKYFNKAIACISPLQAGLSVLESMGYGVPFVTSQNAITGGEILNIHNGEDGVVMNSVSQLVDVINDIALNRDKYFQMGERAMQFYNGNRTPQHMSDGLWDAVQYALNH